MTEDRLLAIAVAVRQRRQPVSEVPLKLDEIPVAHTPAGGYAGEMPAPILGDCREPVVAGAPDLRGLWKVVEVEIGGTPAATHPMLGVVQRIEQAGDRMVVTAGGVVHDMRVDGTIEGGVHDVAEMDYSTPINVVASYEDGVHVLRPLGPDDTPVGIEVTRQRDGDNMVWNYVAIRALCERIGEVGDPPARP
jgi:hypothetical protein